VIITFGDEQDDPLPTDDLARLAELVLIEEGLDLDTAVSLTLVDEDTIADLNRVHMGKTGPTDVLSFPIEDAAPGRPPLPEDGGPPLELGDVFIAPGVVRANARRDGVAFDDELSLMVVHGLLHLLGWDHGNDDDATAMEKREGELLSLIGKVRP
jgi:probable rRNA maturation factor